MTMKAVLTISVSAMLIASCGGSSSGNSDNTVDTGGVTGVGGDGSTDGDEKIKNPLIDGGLPVENTELYFPGYDLGQSGILSIDVEDESFIIDDSDGLTFSGDYNPETGTMTITDCSSSDNDDCVDILSEGNNIIELSEISEGSFGEDYVSISPEYSIYFGVNPTDEANLPKTDISVVYQGQSLVNVESDYFEEGDREYYRGSAVGLAETTVNFSEGTVSADFSDYDGDFEGVTAELRGVEISGTEFSGGNLEIDLGNGDVITLEEFYSYGQFFGPNGEELGGVLSGYEAGLIVYGAWNGVAQ